MDRLEASRLRLEPCGLRCKPSRLRLLSTWKAGRLRLLEPRRSLAGEACGLWCDPAWLESWLKLLLLLGIKSRLHWVLEALTPLRHPALANEVDEKEMERK